MEIIKRLFTKNVQLLFPHKATNIRFDYNMICESDYDYPKYNLASLM